MKILKNAIHVALIAILFTQCTDPQESASPAKSTVKFQFSESSSSGGRLSNDDNPVAVLISITNTNNSSKALNMEELTVTSLGDGFITESVELLVNNDYQIDEFIVVNDQNEAIYLTPLEGSEFAGLVEHPLPIPFTVSDSATVDVSLEVIPADLGEAIQFGYSTFSFSVVNTLTRGLIAHYTFDSTITDSGQYGIDLTSSNSASSDSTSADSTVTYSEDRKANATGAIHFDGTYACEASGSSYPSGLYNQSEPQSMSFWMKTDDPNSGQAHGMVRVSQPVGSRFYVSARDNQFQINYGDIQSPPYGDVFLLDSAIADNEWKHVVLISYGDNETGKFYVNGQEVGELEFTITNNNSANPNFQIGGYAPSNLFYTGSLDDVRLYNRALTHKEIVQLYME